MPDEAILDKLSQPLEQPPPRRAGTKSHTIAFRVDDEQMLAADALRQTFPGGTFSEAFAWILSSGPGRALIAQRVRGEIQ